MAYKELVFALGMIAATSPVAATQTEPTPASMAPAAPPEARYCLRVEAVTGSRIETIQCETRAEWAAEEIDVDHEWAENGVRVIA